MSHRTIETRHVSPAGHYAPDKWVTVRAVNTSGDTTTLDVGYCLIVRHALQGIAVKRGRAC